MKNLLLWITLNIRSLLGEQSSTDKRTEITQISTEQYIKGWRDRAFEHATQSIDMDGDIRAMNLEVDGKIVSIQMHYIEATGQLEYDISHQQEMLDSISENFQVHVVTARDQLPKKYLIKINELEGAVVELEHSVKDTDIRLKRLNKDWGENLELKMNPAIGKIGMYVVSVSYLCVATILNQPLFENLMQGVPIGGYILAPGLAIIELMLAHYCGNSYAENNKRQGHISLAIGMALLGYIFSQQTDIMASFILLVLYLVSVLLSFSYHKGQRVFKMLQLKKQLTKSLAKLCAKLVQTRDSLEKAREDRDIKAAEIVNKRAEKFKENIENDQRSVIRLEMEKDRSTQMWENTRKEAKEAIEQGYSDYGIPQA